MLEASESHALRFRSHAFDLFSATKTENVILIKAIRYAGARLSSYRCAQSLSHGHIVLGRYARGLRIPSSEISLQRVRVGLHHSVLTTAKCHITNVKSHGSCSTVRAASFHRYSGMAELLNMMKELELHCIRLGATDVSHRTWEQNRKCDSDRVPPL